jgi:hypothetical protein
MKKYLQFKITAISILLLVSFYYLSCDIKSPVEGVNVIFNTQPISTVVSGSIVDAATGEPIQGKTVYLTIEGNNNNDVVTLTSTPQTNFSTTVGFVDFALVETAKPTETSPVKFVIVAKCAGYLTNNLPFSITKTGDANFTIYMVNESNLPTGTANASSNGQADNSGVVQSSFNVTANESQANVSASMYIPKGTVLMDANGTLLRGNVTASLTYFNNKNEESLRSLPGGYSITANKNSIKNDGAFLTAGFFNMSIKDAYGVEAKRVSKKGLSKIADGDTVKPLITIEIPDNTINPETGVAVKAGDSIDVWSINQSTSIWNQEQKVVIRGPDSNGKLFVQFRIDHLSCWNLDWFQNSCVTGITLKIVGKPAGRQIKLVMSGQAGSYHNTLVTTDNEVTFRYAPMNITTTITAYDERNKVVGSITIPNLCGSGPVTFNVDYGTVTPSVSVIINSEGYCQCNSNLVIRPNGNPIWYKIDSQTYSSWVYAGNLVNGSITIPGIQTQVEYTYATWYEGNWYTIGATIYTDHAEIDAGLLSSNIVSSQISQSGGYTILKFSGKLSSSICADFCKTSGK